MKRAALVAIAMVSVSVRAETDDESAPHTSYAIQERSYRLTFEIDAIGGLMPVDIFTKQAYAGAAVIIHFTDFIAWEVLRGGYAFSWSSSLRQQLERDFLVLPSAFPSVQFFGGTHLLFKPFYGKLTVANQYVLYLEGYFELGATLFKYTSSFRPSVDFGGGIRLFHTHWLSYRIDLLNSVVLLGGVTNSLSLNLMICLNIGS